MEPARQSKLGVFSRSLRSSLLPDFMKTLMVPLSCGLFNCSVSVDWYMITSMTGACPKDVQRRQEGFLSALPEILVGLKRRLSSLEDDAGCRLPELEP